MEQEEALQAKNLQLIRDAAVDLIEHIAGGQCSESEIDKAFAHPGLGERVNRLRRALGIATK